MYATHMTSQVLHLKSVNKRYRGATRLSLFIAKNLAYCSPSASLLLPEIQTYLNRKLFARGSSGISEDVLDLDHLLDLLDGVQPLPNSVSSRRNSLVRQLEVDVPQRVRRFVPAFVHHLAVAPFE